MKGIRRVTIFLLFILIGHLGLGQTFSAKIVDETTGSPIAYASVQLSESYGVISDENGIFTFVLQKKLSTKDPITVSALGYKTKLFSIANGTSNLIALTPEPVALQEIVLSNVTLSADDIIKKVKANIPQNYSTEFYKKRIFFRLSDNSDFGKIGLRLNKSSVPGIDQPTLDQFAASLPENAYYYREVLADFYGNSKSNKVSILKAAERYDKEKDGSVTGIMQKLEKVFKENVKEGSYLKMKSGILFSKKIQLDSLYYAADDRVILKDEISKFVKGNFQNIVRKSITDLHKELFFSKKSKIDVLRKTANYDFTLKDYGYIDNTSVYIIQFTPKGKSDFKGELYINTEDFAVIRLEYTNVRSLRKARLLGLSYNEATFSGKMLFTKETNDKYSPKYLELVDGKLLGIKRPLKLKEKNKGVKGRRKQNEIALDIHLKNANTLKYEFFVFDSKPISLQSFQHVKENNGIHATYLAMYDPHFWEAYAKLSPNEAIKEVGLVN